MSEIVLAAGSVAGVFTAIAIDKVSHMNTKSRHNEGVMRYDYDKVELERRIVYEAMRRVYDYERAGRITSIEREKLLARYRRQLDAFTDMISPRFNAGDVSSFKSDLISMVDQRMAQLNAKLDDLADRMNNNVAQKPAVSNVERKEEKPTVQKKVEQVTAVDATETTESDASLDEIKKQIMQTLSRLEQAEVE
ncbi:MAG: hypothetical protein ACRD38_01250 [Nitrososphaerales archaeon]